MVPSHSNQPHQTQSVGLHETSNAVTSKSVKHWPHLIWFIMKISGIFYHDTTVYKRRCPTCEMNHFEQCITRNGRGFFNIEHCDSISAFHHVTLYERADIRKEDRTPSLDNPQCEACQTCWWNRYGQVTVYSEENIGVHLWNHTGSWFISIVMLFTLIIMIFFNFRAICQRMWGQDSQILHFMSYTSFLCAISVYPVINMCSKIRSVMSGRGPGAWATSMNARFIIHRLQFLDLPGRGLPGKLFLAICVTVPLMCALYRIYIDFILKTKYHYKSITENDKISVFVTGIVEIMWGCFVYLLFLIRISFQVQLDLTLKYIALKEGQFDLCKTIISRIAMEFNCFKQCAALYMTVLIPSCVLGVTTNLTWQYMLHNSETTDMMTVEQNINILIWCELAMFILLGPIALGGINVDCIWENFRTNIVYLQTQRQQEFWDRLIKYMTYLQDDSSVVSLTMIFSIVGFYMAVEFGKQDLLY